MLKKALDFFVMYGIEQSINYDLKRYQYLSEYDAALPDDLPVIPEAVGEILRSAHGQNNLLCVLDTAKNGHKVSEALAWILANQNTFATAWVLGVWRVEETGEIVKLEAEK
ncbi:hypothetical protein HMPREF0530_1440 [Lacticaseibacillus paracasei subsp. paracasei ATCC 25302 = DSM 5622 = JCM 8130]|nr:hypothetical protein [Lacticaseibacillus paracasei]EEI68328.1 hypothetical protein HMPREF0530_1440 [Lacticaseibacillus paracasei subsp. paracasei ATCC 25302 = DSM 5622 = JCM 8130]KRM65956.1 hypothetical protein FC74_GL000710 [Lacticaseibacillus paracasei subsp. paracasei ATCC 25302 = DSM 5622 = JCM 8130]TDG84482.1 hypothetical protein C5L26_002928 [Lacticaseibacillus paracasei subsp. paracasei]BAN72193.1 hypothetical protein LBPC_1897 [Lacticaseibacillus paracasei subsp. paracasei]GEL30777.